MKTTMLLLMILGITFGYSQKITIDKAKDYKDIYHGMLIEKDNKLYFKKCAIVDEEMQIINEFGNPDKKIIELFEKNKSHSKIQLSIIAFVKEINEKYFIYIEEIDNLILDKTCNLFE